MAASTAFRISRRAFVAQASALAAGGLAGRAMAQGSDTVRIGQSVDLGGPLAELGKAMHLGAKACFAAINAAGGVHGRQLELVGKDDGYNVQRSLANMKSFMADPGMFAMFGCMGTPMIEAVLPLLKATDMPLFTPLTGATSARPAGMRQVMNIRASYPEETERLIEHLATVGIKRIAIVSQHNSFGAEVAQAAQGAIARRKLTAVIAVTVENDASDADAAAVKVAQAQPEAVFVGLAGKPTIQFVKAIRRESKGMPLYALSVMGTAATLDALKDDGVGIAMTQVVPLPTNGVVPVVRDFLQAWRAQGAGLEPSHLALEGYINARVFAEALKRAGPKLSRAAFIDAVYGLKKLDLGGFEIGFHEPGRNASRFIELTMVGRNGRFVR
ncbi:ABC transporter substrate-binding protein [Ideonella sp. BN130291]|uniref:ABC transporter substrate-binding protein n=1 Tax=Ideonella sp. BN130291 TaxID=3112940 RepID=UPI002E2527A0|nr:ABC transporter substrate-binding protein [Ideonella sp. BN130291]